MTDDYRPINARTGKVKDMPLVDDLADVLAHMVVGWDPNTVYRGIDLEHHPDVVRVMARYREAKTEKPSEQVIQRAIGLAVQTDCNVFGTSVWQRIEGVIRRADPSSVVFHIEETPS